jgi:hypothetical protein
VKGAQAIIAAPSDASLCEEIFRRYKIDAARELMEMSVNQIKANAGKKSTVNREHLQPMVHKRPEIAS